MVAGFVGSKAMFSIISPWLVPSCAKGLQWSPPSRDSNKDPAPDPSRIWSGWDGSNAKVRALPPNGPSIRHWAWAAPASAIANTITITGPRFNIDLSNEVLIPSPCSGPTRPDSAPARNLNRRPRPRQEKPRPDAKEYRIQPGKVLSGAPILPSAPVTLESKPYWPVAVFM